MKEIQHQRPSIHRSINHLSSLPRCSVDFFFLVLQIAPAEPQAYEEPKPGPRVEELKDDIETVLKVAPKKPNWDLKRDIAANLEKLERRTQRAIAELAHLEEEKRAQEGQEEE